MLKKTLFFCISLILANNIFANNIINATIEINGVTVNGGLVYVAVYSNERDYINETSLFSFTLQPSRSTLTYSLELPEGEYVITTFQDTNNNGILDTNIFGVPTEPVGKNNYNLRGTSGNFHNLKVIINNSSTRLIVNMGRVRII
ncbi:MAG: DUF2141 domain-containing protein [Treponema sp.]|nr:DUF2141 domain-containing protein [Treponema sp.]